MQWDWEDLFSPIGIVVVFFAIFIGIALLYAIPIYFLWNWLMPIIFNLPTITFWQAMGLSLLSSFLIKSSSSSNKD